MTDGGPTAAPDGVIDLLGLLAYGSLVSFFRLSDDASLAASIEDKAALAEMAVAEFGHFQLARRHIEQADFYMAVTGLLDPQTRALVTEVLADTGHAEFAISHVRAAIEAGPKVAGRLALWARRLAGEALGQAQRVAAEREPLARLLAERLAQPATSSPAARSVRRQSGRTAQPNPTRRASPTPKST